MGKARRLRCAPLELTVIGMIATLNPNPKPYFHPYEGLLEKGGGGGASLVVDIIHSLLVVAFVSFPCTPTGISRTWLVRDSGFRSRVEGVDQVRGTLNPKPQALNPKP